VIQAALQFIAEQDEFLRRTVHMLLTLTEDAAVVPYLAEALTKPDAWVRQCAAEVLSMLGEKGRDAVPTLVDMAQAGGTEGVMALQTLTKIGDPRAIPVCLTHMQYGPPALQHEALLALAVLTDAKNFDMVLYPILALRDTMPMERKASFNQAAATLVRRFPGRVTSDKLLSSPMSQTSLSVFDTPLLVHTPLLVELPSQEVIPATAEAAVQPTGVQETSALNPAMSPPGTMLGSRYRVIRRIGEGGFGTVMLVNDTVVNEELILKFLHPHLAADQLVMQRFIHELLYTRRITHDNVIRIHDFLRLENTYAIAMEYFPGHSLSTEVAEQRFVTDIPSGLQILVSICRGMQRAHQLGILHRDMKPANILINDQGVVKIVDFGLASMVTGEATQLTRAGEMLGTPLYMAPEQARNRKLDARTDIYSLGVVMYEMLTGRLPYAGDRALAILFQHVEGKATPPRALNPHISPAVEAVILKAMAVEPEQRFQSMEEFEHSLLALLS
jgi:serine/threonine-protein kinase